MRRRWAAVLAMAVASVAAPRAVPAQEPAQPGPPANPSPTTASSPPATAPLGYGTTVADLRTTLTDPATSATDRLEAARRLVARQSAEARGALSSVVSAPANAPARIAALRALADDANPDPALLKPLVAIVQSDNDERVVAAAAVALGAYKANRAALDALTQAASATTRPQPLRAAAMRGLALLVEQAAAATLVAIATNPNEPAQVVADATDALVELTGLESNGHDPAKWDAWQKQNAALAPADWKAAVADTRAVRDQRVRRHLDELVDELQPMFEEQYATTPPAKMPERLLKFLGGTAPEVRRIGARIAYRASGNAWGLQGRPTAEVQARLEDLVGDADAGVRLEALLALENLIVGDRSLAAIRRQLPIEPDSRVKAAMARTLSKLPGIVALPDISQLLDDASPAVVREAANAIRLRAAQVVQQAPLEQATTTKLQGTIRRLPKTPPNMEAIRTCAEALKALNASTAMTFATELLASPDPDTRAAGLTMLGELGPRVAPLIIDAVKAEQGQSPPAIRLRRAGMEALARAGEFTQAAEFLPARMNPRVEPNADVRNAARNAYRTLLLKERDTDKLLQEVKRFGDDLPMRVEVLKALVDRFTEAKKLEDAAIQQVSLADDYTKLGRLADAVTVRQEAINHYLQRGILDEQLVRRQTESMLQTQQYARLATLAQTLFAQGTEIQRGLYQQAIGGRVRNEAFRLVGTEQDDPRTKQADWDNAAKLIETFSKIDPPLADTYLEDLRQASTRLEAQRRRAARTQPGSR